MSFVLDASVAIAWCFADEASAAGDALLDRLGDEEAVVPDHWALEIGNILAMAERRNRIDSAGITGLVAILRALNIRVEHVSLDRGFAEILTLARAQGLTTAKAAYLDLAMREGLPLATRDHGLMEAAQRVGVVTLVA
jgi:predicted nucleic acid-binding protein